MARDFFINGESMVWLKGASDTYFSALTELGLSDREIRVTPEIRHGDIPVDAWGQGQVPVDVQYMAAAVNVTMTLINVDRTAISQALLLSMGLGGADGGNVGQIGRTGKRLGGGNARLAVGNKYLGLNIASPIGGLPWRFYYAYLTGNPFDAPLGTERSIFTLNWRCIPYSTDPWNGGIGSYLGYLFDHTLDS